MKVEQIYQLSNDVTAESLGKENLLREDLSNVVEWGDSIQNVMGVENFTKKIIDKIGKTIISARSYSPILPNVLMDGWEYGTILEKISYGLPEAQENSSWELEHGHSYDPFIVTIPEVQEKFWNGLKTFEIPVTRAIRQTKSAFKNAEALNSFYSGLDIQVSNAMNIRIDEISMRTINNMIGETFYDLDSSGNYSGKTGSKCVNLLYLYNETVPAGDALTAEEFIRTPEAIRFAVNVFKNYIDRIRRMTTIFNLGQQPRFTPLDRLNVIMLSEFKNAAEVYLQSQTFHDQYTALPGSTSQIAWQGTGDDFSFANNSSIKIKTSNGHDIDASGILAVMFDRDALGVCNQNQRTTSQANGRAEFINYWHKFDANYFNDANENFIVFYAA